MKRFDLRELVCFGSLVFAASCWLNTWMSPDYAGDQFVFSNVIRALGIASGANFIQGFALYGSVYLLPQYLTIVQSYDAFQTGQTVALSTLPKSKQPLGFRWYRFKWTRGLLGRP